MRETEGNSQVSAMYLWHPRVGTVRQDAIPIQAEARVWGRKDSEPRCDGCVCGDAGEQDTSSLHWLLLLCPGPLAGRVESQLGGPSADHPA